MRLAIRVKPGASHTRVGGTYDGTLVVAVQSGSWMAMRRGGAGSRGLLRWPVIRDVTLVSGASSRTKIIEIPDGYEDRVSSLYE